MHLQQYIFLLFYMVGNGSVEIRIFFFSYLNEYSLIKNAYKSDLCHFLSLRSRSCDAKEKKIIGSKNSGKAISISFFFLFFFLLVLSCVCNLRNPRVEPICQEICHMK